MSHALATVAVSFKDPDGSRADAVEAVLKRMGAPANDAFRKKLNCTQIVHFMSINVIRDTLEKNTHHLLLELSADGGTNAALRIVAEALREPLREIFHAAGVTVPNEGHAELLIRNHWKIAQRWFAPALGLPFDGSPGMSVRRLIRERELAHRIGQMDDILSARITAREKIEQIRNRLWKEGDTKWVFVARPTPILQPPKRPRPDNPENIPFLLRLLPLLGMSLPIAWPALLASAVLCIALTSLFWTIGWLGALLIGLLTAVVITAVIVLGAGYLLVLYLRHLESTDHPIDQAPNPEQVGEVMKREGVYAQGLLASVSPIKRGSFRRYFVLRFAFWFIGSGVRLYAVPGFLGQIGVIHFARWFVLPGTNKLFFWSNYDGSWESYVEDFIQLGHEGVTAIWSNTEGFPRTHNLFKDGATDGDRLRRWARNQMYAPLFWYSGYPSLTLARMRRNAEICAGLVTVRADAEAEDWLALFGAAPPAATTLDRTEIPTLLFGGRKHLRFAACLVVTMSDKPDQCRKWLSDIASEITYGHQRCDSALVLGLSTSGFCKLGVPKEDLDTFPAAFRNGMTAAWRSNALGDIERNAPTQWRWGANDKPADAVLLLYAFSEAELQAKTDWLCECATKRGQALSYKIDLCELPADDRPLREPFGFIDGISQPILKGSPGDRDGANRLHVVEPGEFVLGYKDNSGHYPSTPSVHARLDPERLLRDLAEVSPTETAQSARYSWGGRRDLGRNGTYLVVRQLEQDVTGFEHWLTMEAEAQRGSPLGEQVSDEPEARKELIAAKLMGRWRANGTSLVRHPVPHLAGRHREPDNAFRFAAEDAQGLACPFGAHIRRANPRDSLNPTSQAAISITNRHRIIRVGRSYGPTKGPKQGTLFMCLNADIERQFEFLQQSWVGGRNFLALEDEADPLNSLRRHGEKTFTVPTRRGPVTLRGLPDFVRVRGGGYFFMPSRQAIRWLAQLQIPVPTGSSPHQPVPG